MTGDVMKGRRLAHDVVVLHQDYDGRGPQPLTLQAQDYHPCPRCKAKVGQPCMQRGADTSLALRRARRPKTIRVGVHVARFDSLLRFFRQRIGR